MIHLSLSTEILHFRLVQATIKHYFEFNTFIVIQLIAMFHDCNLF